MGNIKISSFRLLTCENVTFQTFPDPNVNKVSELLFLKSEHKTMTIKHRNVTESKQINFHNTFCVAKQLLKYERNCSVNTQDQNRPKTKQTEP